MLKNDSNLSESCQNSRNACDFVLLRGSEDAVNDQKPDGNFACARLLAGPSDPQYKSTCPCLRHSLMLSGTRNAQKSLKFAVSVVSNIWKIRQNTDGSVRSGGNYQIREICESAVPKPVKNQPEVVPTPSHRKLRMFLLLLHALTKQGAI